MIRIGLNHEDALVLDGLKRVLSAESDMQIVSTTSRVGDMLVQTEIERPDMLILDAVLADADILDVIAQVQSLPLTPNLLIFSTVKDAAKISEILAAGVLGFYSRCDDPTLIPAVARAVAAGLPSVSPIVRQCLLEGLQAHTVAPTDANFTPQEQKVLHLFAQGNNLQQTVFAMNISERTLRYHMDNIRAKTGLDTREEIIVYAVRHDFDRDMSDE